jgi:hypothetical protein
MEAHGLAALDFSTRSDVTVDAMLGYAQERDGRVADAAARLLVQIQLRLHAQHANAASAAIRQQMAAAAHLAASTQFLATANARIAEINRVPQKSPRYRLSYLAPMQRDMVGFLQLEPSCLARGTTNPWMDAGCNALGVNFSKARQYLGTRLPGMIRIDAFTFRSKGAPAALVTTMEQQLSGGNLEAACRTHDDLIGIVESAGGI